MGRTVAWVAILTACYTGGAPAPAPPTPARPDPHGWREAVVEAAFTNLAAGNVDAVVALADAEVIATNPDDCTARLRSALAEAARKLRGKAVDALSLSLVRTHRTLAAGATFGGGCIAKTDLALHHVVAHGHHGRASIELDLVETGGRYYLAAAPAVETSNSAVILRKMREYTDRMCGCVDKTCADEVQDEMTKDFTRLARTAPRNQKPDADMVRASSEVMRRYVDCMSKLMAAGNP